MNKKDDQYIQLSVIVAVYNVQQYIRRCLDSIIRQTYKDVQIILVDDGSTDESGRICDEYALIDYRIQVIHKENGGLVSARKAGLREAVGKYVINIDSDDWIEENAIASVMEKIEIYCPDLLVFGYKKEYGEFMQEYKVGLDDGMYEGEQFWKRFNQCFDESLFFCQPIDMLQWNKVVKKEILDIYQMICPDQLKKNTDDAVTLPCLLNSHSIYVETRCFYHYCVRRDSVVWHSGTEDYDQIVLLINYLTLAYIKGKNKTYIKKEFLLNKIFYHLLLDVPEKFMKEGKCMFLPSVKTGSRIIIYGKGVFANRLLNCINQFGDYKIVDNIDKLDSEKVVGFDEAQYDYIVIAILNAYIIKESMEKLKQLGVKNEKVLYIKKTDLKFDLLPIEIRGVLNGGEIC